MNQNYSALASNSLFPTSFSPSHNALHLCVFWIRKEKKSSVRFSFLAKCCFLPQNRFFFISMNNKRDDRVNRNREKRIRKHCRDDWLKKENQFPSIRELFELHFCDYLHRTSVHWIFIITLKPLIKYLCNAQKPPKQSEIFHHQTKNSAQQIIFYSAERLKGILGRDFEELSCTQLNSNTTKKKYNREVISIFCD